MEELISDAFVPLSPIHFFQLSWECPLFSSGKTLTESKYLLPDTSLLFGTESFANVWLGWNREGLHAALEVKEPLQHCEYPQIVQGDSIELMVDTRDIKTSGYNTKFCHHFYFLPTAVGQRQMGEITHFRTESHPLCEPEQLKMEVKRKSTGYRMDIFLSKDVLYGYDPEQFDRLGFTYRINRYRNDPQNFSADSSEFVIEQQPSLWSSVKLKS